MRIPKFVSVIGTLLLVPVVGVTAGLLAGRARAQSPEPQMFVVQAGAFGPSNTELLAFAPQSLQVHRGDTVTWAVTGFHNVRFASEPTDFVVVTEVDGQPVPNINPAIAFPTIENGGVFSGGEVNSGLPTTPESRFFSLTLDLEPGAYSYLCDVHPGMAGVINVVADDVAIPGPSEVAFQASAEAMSTLGAGYEASIVVEAETMRAETIQAGSGPDTGRVTINQYFPFTQTIAAGETVTWTNPDGGVEPHTVSWPPARNQDVVPMPVGDGPPLLAVGPSIAPMTESGAEIGQGDAFSSGLFLPGQSFTLTFTEPGVYPFTCNIHPGMNGVIVVEPA